MSGRVLIQWRHNICADIARSRYMNPDKTRAVHTEIANIFFQQEQDDTDEISSEHNSDVKTSGKFICQYQKGSAILIHYTIDNHSYPITDIKLLRIFLIFIAQINGCIHI